MHHQSFNGRTIAVFDLGGTTFRRGVFDGGTNLRFKEEAPSLNYVTHPEYRAAELQQGAIDYVVDSIRTLRQAVGEIRYAAISLGAAVDENTGLVLQSGPLWGPFSGGFDMLSALRRTESSVQWYLANDVTAALNGYVSDCFNNGIAASRIAILTVSTGIALRTFDCEAVVVPVDRSFGIQGEVGHLTTNCAFRDIYLTQTCDCGGINHINAFSSGRGISRVIRHLQQELSHDFEKSTLRQLSKAVEIDQLNRLFACAIKDGDELAQEILDAITLPVAQLLLQLFTIDARVELVGLTGGVISGVGESYREAILKHLERLGLYQISDRDPTIFRRRLQVVPQNADLGLIGVGRMASQHWARGRTVSAVVKSDDEWILRYDRPGAIRIFTTDDVFNPANLALKSHLDGQRCVLLCDSGVDHYYARSIRRYFAEHFSETVVECFNTSESLKTTELVLDVLDLFELTKVRRRGDLIVVCGGGVLLDAVGLAAATYRRGVSYCRIPTTMMSMIDAGVGFKVGVNYANAKNRLGAFYPPTSVILDWRFLRTLADRHIRNGVAEIVKLGVVLDERLFELLERYGPSAVADKFQRSEQYQAIMSRAITIMLGELSSNPFEDTLERAVDFGHSFSPALEMVSKGDLLHGEAVAIDITISTIIAQRRRLISARVATRILHLLKALGLPTNSSHLTRQLLIESLAQCSNHRGNLQRIPVPTSQIGQVSFLNDVSAEEMSEVFDLIQSQEAVAITPSSCA